MYLRDTLKLIQSAIQNFSEKLSSSTIQLLGSKFQQLFDELIVKCEKKRLFPHTMGLWLSLMIFNSENLLANPNWEDIYNLVQMTINGVMKFTSFYYKKLLKLGLVKLLSFLLNNNGE